MALTLPDTSAWLAEDVGAGDVTTLALIDEDATCKAVVLAKEPGVVCGLEAATAVFAELGVGFEPLVAEGAEVERGPIAELEGPARGVLTGERLALNLIGRLSGIATLTRRYVDAVEGTGATILDTRKTTPGLRALEKHAVATGGAQNHRFGLDDGVLVKDNHLRLTGGIAAAVAALRAATDLPIEVEAETLEQVREAIEAGADAILLDNMSTDELREAVALVAGRAKLEASGGVNSRHRPRDRGDRSRLHLRRRAHPFRPLARRLPGGAPVTTQTISRMQDEVKALARERDAVILAHNYQVPEVQDVADYVGDSLGLSREAADTDASAIVFCGVHFMAETAKILSPDKTVLIPDLDAGCSLAASITADQLREWKAEHPGATVVSYVNTTAEVKSESDYCCTSGNAKAIIDAVPEDEEILFLPDLYLGVWLEKVTGRKLNIWMGECHVHAGIRPADIERWQADAPDAEFLVHPECGCASQCMAFGNENTHILGTESMIKFAKQSPKERFLIATETGIIHRLKKDVPGKTFEAVSEDAICKYMKMITLEKLRDSLRDWKFEVEVEPEIAAKARLAIQRMVEIG